MSLPCCCLFSESTKEDTTHKFPQLRGPVRFEIEMPPNFRLVITRKVKPRDESTIIYQSRLLPPAPLVSFLGIATDDFISEPCCQTLSKYLLVIPLSKQPYIDYLVGNSHPELARKVAERFVKPFMITLTSRRLGLKLAKAVILKTSNCETAITIGTSV